MVSDQDEIYQEHILDHFEDPYHRGACPQATHCHRERNPLCGDEICVQLRINPTGQIEDCYFDGHGCSVSQSSASMLMEQIDGKSLDDVKHFSAQDMLKLFGARLTPNRQKCCLLAWKVLQSALYSPAGSRESEDDAAV